ncbi:MAG TPA: sporulation protein [Nonomuraea sp.]|nr:sporulation protein [Nonomuraea sp.]
MDTVLKQVDAQPGGMVSGSIHIEGGAHPVNIASVNLALASEIETDDGDRAAVIEYDKESIYGTLWLPPGGREIIDFELPLAWDIPLTHFYGQALGGTSIGVATELEINGGFSSTDLDLIAVHPLPSQQRILEAFHNLGFHFEGAFCEEGQISGLDLSGYDLLPFYQEIELTPPPGQTYGITQLEVTFVAGPHDMIVVLELDKRGGLFSSDHEVFGSLVADHRTSLQIDWEKELDHVLRESGRRRGLF